MSTLRARVVGSTIYAYQRVARFTRVGRWPLTIGVRIVVRDGDERVLLVRHTYAPGWHFPGGAVDRRETAVDAAVRELREETGYEGEKARPLASVFANPAIMSNTCHTVLVENCSLRHAVQWDSGEDMLTRLVPVAEVPGLVAEGKIKHPLVVVALYHFELWMRRKE